MKIGICGGTFDPFHRGHLEPVLAARDQLQWDRILYIPAWKQPFKSDRESASAYHRFAMAVLATNSHDDVYVSPMELQRGGTSYTIDTLDALHAQWPGAELDWIIGADNVADLLKWKDPDRLFAMTRFAVLQRDAGQAIPPAGANIIFLDTPLVPISSTEIRRRVRNGEPIDAFVDPSVSRYILRNGLYKEGHP